MRFSAALYPLAMLWLLAPAAAAEDSVVESGKQISLEYTLKLDDGSTVDSNVGKAPLIFVMGAGSVLPGLESELMGLGLRQSKKITLSPEQGYGPVKDEAFDQVETERIPEDAREVGAILIAQDGQGGRIPVRVHQVGDEQITLDYNHPLAGKTLNFDVKVLGIEDAPSPPEASEVPAPEAP